MEKLPVLKLERMCFENICYSRKEVNIPNPLNYEMKFEKSVSTPEDGIHYRVKLTAIIESKNSEISLSATLVGYFICECDDEQTKKGLVNDNTIAILFPYLRSQISLITTQPDMPPIVLPAVNVVELFKNS